MQGDRLKLAIAYRNLSELDMDSILVKTWVINEIGQVINLSYHRVSPLASNSFIVDSIFSSVEIFLSFK